MSDVYRRPGSPYWYYDVSVNGERKRRSTKRTKKAEAELVAREKLKEALDVQQFGAQRELTLREALFDHYLPTKVRDASHKHLVRYCEYLVGERLPGREDLGPLVRVVVDEATGTKTTERVKPLANGGGTKMHDLTSSDLRQYRSRRLASGMSDQSVDHEIKCVSAAYNLVKGDYRVRPGLKFPLARVKGKPRFLLEDEEKALLADLDPARPIKIRSKLTTFSGPLARVAMQRQDNYDLAVMLLDTGARYSEIAHLTWAMVDTLGFTWVHIFREKVDNEGRLATTARMREVLRRRWAQRRNSAYVFPGWHLGQDDDDLPRVSTAAIRRAMQRVRINAPANVARFGRRDVRCLRDTFATKLRMGRPDKGIPPMSLDQLQKLLGHSTPQMTQKYADLTMDRATELAVASLDVLNEETTHART